MISVILLILAAICDALMDTLKDHYIDSIFKNLKKEVWNAEISWKYCKKYFGYHMDPWHYSKSCMIILVSLAIVLYKPLINPIADFFILGILWNLVFNVFYTHIFISK